MSVRIQFRPQAGSAAASAEGENRPSVFRVQAGSAARLAESARNGDVQDERLAVQSGSGVRIGLRASSGRIIGGFGSPRSRTVSESGHEAPTKFEAPYPEVQETSRMATSVEKHPPGRGWAGTFRSLFQKPQAEN